MFFFLFTVLVFLNGQGETESMYDQSLTISLSFISFLWESVV